MAQGLINDQAEVGAMEPFLVALESVLRWAKPVPAPMVRKDLPSDAMCGGWCE